MIVVITAPAEVKDEAETVRRLFADGLDYLHLRRPGSKTSDLVRFIEKIPTELHPRIVLHSKYSMRRRFTEISRVHFPERFAKKIRRAPRHPYSVSIHAASRNSPLLSGSLYALFGPIFPSLSKKGYVPKISAAELTAWCRISPAPVVGVGGITLERIGEARRLGLSGIALHSEIWNRDPADRIAIFRKAREIWSSTHEG